MPDIFGGPTPQDLAELWEASNYRYQTQPTTAGPSPAEPALLPAQIDPRATARGVMVVQPRGVPLTWRVTNVHWLDEQESQGRHHIYADVLDEQGKRLANVPLMVRWPTGESRIATEQKPGEPYAANFPMSPSRNEFSVTVDGLGLSDVVAGIGMGADTPGGYNAGIHTSTAVVFQRVGVATQPTPAPSTDYVPSTPYPMFVNVPAGANVRDKSVTGKVLVAVPYRTQVTVEGTDSKSGWRLVQYGDVTGWMAPMLLSARQPEPDEDGPTPAPMPVVQTGVLDPRVLEAILQVESGGKTRGGDGRPTIRFESHIFRDRASDKARVDQFFRFNADKPWTGQEWRRSESDPWQPIHTGKQADEYAAFKFAQRFVPSIAASEAISMGAGQIMGFNHARIGYPNAEAMYNAFDRSDNAQTIGMINYILSDPKLVGAINARDWKGIANGYNGSGNVEEAAAKYKSAYERLSA